MRASTELRCRSSAALDRHQRLDARCERGLDQGELRVQVDRQSGTFRPGVHDDTAARCDADQARASRLEPMDTPSDCANPRRERPIQDAGDVVAIDRVERRPGKVRRHERPRMSHVGDALTFRRKTRVRYDVRPACRRFSR